MSWFHIKIQKGDILFLTDGLGEIYAPLKSDCLEQLSQFEPGDLPFQTRASTHAECVLPLFFIFLCLVCRDLCESVS